MLSFTLEGSEEYGPSFEVVRRVIGGEDVPWAEVDEATLHILNGVDSNDYTCWSARFMKVTNEGLDDELKVLDDLQVKNSKSFALWSHRESICDLKRNSLATEDQATFLTGELSKIKASICEALMCRKNHCTWTYRLFLFTRLMDLPEAAFKDGDISRAALLRTEREEIWEDIHRDIWNNSVWACLSSLLFLSFADSPLPAGDWWSETTAEDPAVMEWWTESMRVVKVILYRPNNISAWTYWTSLYSRKEAPGAVPGLPPLTSDTFPADAFRDLFQTREAQPGLKPEILSYVHCFIETECPELLPVIDCESSPAP